MAGLGGAWTGPPACAGRHPVLRLPWPGAGAGRQHTGLDARAGGSWAGPGGAWTGPPRLRRAAACAEAGLGVARRPGPRPLVHKY